MSEAEKKAIDELIMLKHFLETEEKYEGQEREVNAIEIALNLIIKLQKENEEKDKQIDLMANKIFEEGINWDNKDEVKQYFANKVKEEGE